MENYKLDIDEKRYWHFWKNQIIKTMHKTTERSTVEVPDFTSKVSLNLEDFILIDYRVFHSKLIRTIYGKL